MYDVETYPLKSQGDFILELFLQKQRAACSSCILLDIFNCHQHRLLVSCIWDSSPSRAQWVCRVAVALCTGGRIDSLDRHPIMVTTGVQCHCHKPVDQILRLYLPPSPTQTKRSGIKGLLRSKEGWFTEREEIIMVTRILRDDPGKATMHNVICSLLNRVHNCTGIANQSQRQAINFRLLWNSLSDYDM